MVFNIFILLITGLNSYLYYSNKDAFSFIGIMAGVAALITNLVYPIYKKSKKNE